MIHWMGTPWGASTARCRRPRLRQRAVEPVHENALPSLSERRWPEVQPRSRTKGTHEGALAHSRAAKRDFLPICRRVLEEEEKAYVHDKAGRRYLTLDGVERNLPSPVVDVSAQFFKDNFSRMSSLVKDGLCFRLTLRRSNRPLYARRHTGYSDPVDAVIEAWRERVVASALAERERGEVLSALRELGRGQVSNQDALLAALDKLTRGVARMAIGHKPFEEGLMPPGTRPVMDGR